MTTPSPASKASCPRRELIDALSMAASVIDGRDLTASMTCAMISSRNGVPEMLATDGVQNVVVKLPGLTGSAHFLIPVAKALGFLKAAGGGDSDVSISSKQEGVVTLSTRGGGKIDLACPDPESFPDLDTIYQTGSSAEAVLPESALSYLLISASSGSNNAAEHVKNTALSGTHLDVGHGSITAVCSDQISVVAVEYEAATTAAKAATVPHQTAKLFINALDPSSSQDVTLVISDRFAAVRTPTHYVGGPLLQMAYPNWRKWVQAGRSGDMKLKRKGGPDPSPDEKTPLALEYACQADDFLTAVRLAATAADRTDSTPSVLLTMADGTCTAESRGEFGGGTVATAHFEASSLGHKEQSEARVQATRLAKVLSACKGGPVKVFIGANAIGIHAHPVSATIARIHHTRSGRDDAS